MDPGWRRTLRQYTKISRDKVMKIRRDQPNIKKLKLPYLCVVDVILLLCITIALASVLATSHLVPTVYLLLIVVAYLGITVGIFFLTRSDQNRKLQITGTVLTAVILIVSFVAGYYLVRTIHTVQSVANVSVERSTVTFYTLHDNAAESLEEKHG